MIGLEHYSAHARPGHRCRLPVSELPTDSRPTVMRVPIRKFAVCATVRTPACISVTERRVPAVCLGLLASGMLLLGSPAFGTELLTGVPRTVDGDTLVVRSALVLVTDILPAAVPADLGHVNKLGAALQLAAREPVLNLHAGGRH